MKYVLLVITLLSFLSCSSDNRTKSQNDIPNLINRLREDYEKEYLIKRNGFIEHFKNIEFVENKYVYDQIADSLLVLEKILHEITLGSSSKHFSQNGKINLETLINELGFGKLDGLVIEKKSFRILCTSKFLFYEYFKDLKLNQLGQPTPLDLENIVNGAFSNGAYFTNFTSIKLSSSDSLRAYGLIGTIAQDIGPFLPDYLYVFVEYKNFVYIIEKQLSDHIIEIPECKTIWDSTYLEAKKKSDAYYLSNLQDSLAFDSYVALEEEAWVKYCDCYKQKLKDDIQFANIQKMMETMLQQIVQ